MSRQLTPLALAVLWLLDSEQMHPYEMQQRIRNYAIDEVVKVTHGSLYHTVERLAEQGLIEPVETSREGRRPERTVFAITDQGRDEARSRLRDYLRRPVKEFPAFGMALALISMLCPEDAATLLDLRVVALDANLAAYDAILDGLAKQGIDRVQIVEVEFLSAHLRAEVAYVRALSEDIKAGRLDWAPLHGEG